MNNAQRLSKEYDDINTYFLEQSYELFEKKFNEITFDFIGGTLVIKEKGIIPVKSFCYYLWLMDENSLDAIACIGNHEGAWTFYVHSDISVEYHNHLSDLVTRIFSFQTIDEVTQMEFKRVI